MLRATVRPHRIGERKKNRLRNEHNSEALLRHALIMCGASDDEDDTFAGLGNCDHSFLFQSVSDSDPELYQLFRHGMEGLLFTEETSASDARRIFDRESFTNRLTEVRNSLKDIRQVLYSAAARALVNQLEHLLLLAFKPSSVLAGLAAAVLATGAGAELSDSEQSRLTNVRESPSSAALRAAEGMANLPDCPVSTASHTYGFVMDEIESIFVPVNASKNDLHARLWGAVQKYFPTETAAAVSRYLPVSPSSKPEDSSMVVLFGLRAWQRKIAHAAAKTYGLRSISFDIPPVSGSSNLDGGHMHDALRTRPGKVMVIFPNLKAKGGSPPIAPPLTLAQILLPLPAQYISNRKARDHNNNNHAHDGDMSTVDASPDKRHNSLTRGASVDRGSTDGENENRDPRARSRSRSAPRQLAALQGDLIMQGVMHDATPSPYVASLRPIQPEVMFRVAGEAVAHAKAVERKAERAGKRTALAAMAAKEFLKAERAAEVAGVDLEGRERSASASKQAE